MSMALLAVLAPRAAGAFCRTTTTPIPANYSPSRGCYTDGLVLFWKGACVGYSVNNKASATVPLDTATTVIDAAFETWNAVACSAGNVGIATSNLGPVECTEVRYNPNGPNQNVIVFRDDKWPYSDPNNTLGLTTVTFNADTGEIYDADMEMNSADNKFSSGDTGVEFDLLSIVTHETGHFLGLAHTTDNQATMFPDYQQHSINLRDLAADDIAGICAIYPPGGPSCTCDYTPRHGFSALCAADQTAAVTEPPDPSCVDPSNPTSSSSSGGCAVSAPRGGLPGEVFALLAAALGLGLGARRRRSGPRG